MSRYGVSESDLHRGQRSRPFVQHERCEHDVLHARRLLEGLLDDLEHRHRPPAARRRALGDHDLRLAGLQALRDRGRREAREHGDLDRSEVRDRVRGDRDLGRHRQEDRHAVALLDSECGELLGEARHVAGELGEGQLASASVLAEPHRCDRVGTPLRPAVDAVVRDRQAAADEPGRPLGAARQIDHALPRLCELEAEVVDHERPEPLGLLARTADERPVVGCARTVLEARDVGALDGRLVRPPHDLRSAHAGQPTPPPARLASANLVLANLRDRRVRP